MRKHRLRDLLLYRIDRALRSSFGVQVAGLALFATIAILLGSILVHLIGLAGGWSDALWWTWLRFTDPGYVGEDSGWPLRMASILVTLSGWVIFGLLISVFSAAIQDRLAKLRRGAQSVPERGHTIVLGWDSTVYSVLDQLWADDEGERRRAVVVLADRDKEEMEQSIRRYCLVHRSRHTICRSGSIQSTVCLRNISLASARQVLIVGEQTRVGDQLEDSDVLKAVLACSQVLAQSDRRLPLVTVVAAVQNRLTERLVRPFLDDRTDRMELLLVETGNVLARIIAQCAWQPGLSLVYRDLLTYTGDLELGADVRSSEVYSLSAREAGLPAGTSFRQALCGFSRANLIGYRRQGQATLLNPLVRPGAADLPLAPEDQLLLVADRRQDIHWQPRPHQLPPLAGQAPAGHPRRVLLLGGSQKAHTVLQELASYLPAASLVAASGPLPGDLPAGVQAVQVEYGLNEILAGRLAEPGYDTIVLLADDGDPDQHDAQVLTMMAALRAAGRHSGARPTVVAELYDPRNRELALAADVDDIVVSTELVSNFMVQVAREPERAAVFRELMDEQGNELYVRPVSVYCQDYTQEISFVEIMAAAAERGELAIGYLPRGAIRAELSPLDRWNRRPAFEYHQIVVIAEN